MSRPEAAGTTGNPAAAADVERYVAAVDDLLLDVPWRRRRELIAHLREHIRENPEQIAIEPPHEYAAELRAASGAVPGGLLAGFRSASWPTPVEWCESVLRGGAMVLVVLLTYKLLDYASYFVVGDASARGSLPSELNLALLELSPVPAYGDSTWNGLLIYGALSIVIGQLTTAAVLMRAPHRRGTLRRLSYVSIGIVVLLLGYGAVTSAG